MLCLHDGGGKHHPVPFQPSRSAQHHAALWAQVVQYGQCRKT